MTGLDRLRTDTRCREALLLAALRVEKAIGRRLTNAEADEMILAMARQLDTSDRGAVH